MTRQQYRITWHFPAGRKLVRLIHFNSEESATTAANTRSFYEPIFRRANLYTRSTSAYEYMDRFPIPSSVSVERIER